ncbi:MAG: GNAT family N-acetyltransferase [Akkermansiaceae bacterium]|nr:GNAT family N-acetyltransferase [Akkermansiaceae bacterium]
MVMNTMPAGYSMRLASMADFAAIRAFYNELIDDMADRPFHPMWDKKGHPSDEYLRMATEAGELWVTEGDGAIVAAVIVNGEVNDGYNQVPWQIQADAGEFISVHAFGVSMRLQGQGIGKAMMHAIMDAARAAGKKAIRLDLIDFNLPTGRVYEKLGFRKCAEVKLYYAEVGWQLFHMFEYVL